MNTLSDAIEEAPLDINTAQCTVLEEAPLDASTVQCAVLEEAPLDIRDILSD